jgi:FAD-dependent oxidoreductase family protein/FAD binding domain-containing protein
VAVEPLKRTKRRGFYQQGVRRPVLAYVEEPHETLENRNEKSGTDASERSETGLSLSIFRGFLLRSGLFNNSAAAGQVQNMSKGHIARRKFLQYPVAGIAVAASAGGVLGADAASQLQPTPGRPGSLTTEADVLVVGGGTAGTIAAIQAARAGAKTLLIERGSQLGGTTTTGGVAFPGLFDAWGKQVIAGIGWELVQRAVELDNGSLPDFSTIPERHWQNQVHVNQFVYALLAEEACINAGVRVAYYEFPLSVEKTTDGWVVESVGPGTHRQVKCKQIIDCTGGASVVGMLGLPRLRDDETQPGSLLYELGSKHNVGREQLDRLYVHGADSSTSVTLTKANMDGRKTLLKKLREQKDKARLLHMQPETAHRESYRIQGETLITVDDYVSGRVFGDAVCYAFYPVDLHGRDGVKPKPLVKGTVPTIPLSALVPKGSTNLLVAGRCVSSDRLANSGLRVQASCMAMGQAAGAAAALAAESNTTPLNVSLEDIREMLRKHGAIVPGA